MTTKNQQIIIEIIELDKIIDLICIFIIHISQNEQFVSIWYFQSGQWMWLMELVSIVCVCPAALVCTKHTTLHNAHIHAAQNVYSWSYLKCNNSLQKKSWRPLQWQLNNIQVYWWELSLCHKKINVSPRAASDVRTMQWTIELCSRNNGLRPISLMYGQLGWKDLPAKAEINTAGQT